MTSENLCEWRALPSNEEVATHAARSGGDCWGAWLLLSEDAHGSVRLRLVSIAVTCDDRGEINGVEVCDDSGSVVETREGDLARPVSRLGVAMPWPELGEFVSVEAMQRARDEVLELVADVRWRLARKATTGESPSEEQDEHRGHADAARRGVRCVNGCPKCNAARYLGPMEDW